MAATRASNIYTVHTGEGKWKLWFPYHDLVWVPLSKYFNISHENFKQKEKLTNYLLLNLPDPEGACEWPPLIWSIRSINTKPQHKDRPINTSGSTCEIWCFKASTCESASCTWDFDASVEAVSEWRWEPWLWEPCPYEQEKCKITL